MQKNVQTYLKYLPVFTMQYFKSMFGFFFYIPKERAKLQLFKSILKESSQLFFVKP